MYKSIWYSRESFNVSCGQHNYLWISFDLEHFHNFNYKKESRYFVSLSIIPSDFNNETKKKKQGYVPSFVLGNYVAAKDISFSFAEMYNITGNTICKNLQ